LDASIKSTADFMDAFVVAAVYAAVVVSRFASVPKSLLRGITFKKVFAPPLVAKAGGPRIFAPELDAPEPPPASS